MRQLQAWLLRLGNLFRKSRRERELAAEIESHLQMHIEDNLRSGMTPGEARRQAFIKLGGVEQTKEEYRAQRGLPLIETFLQDMHYSCRMLVKSPGFTTIAVLTLALGIGANTAIFSVVNGVMLKPLPYRQPDRLVSLFLHGQGLDRGSMGEADFLALDERQHVFEHVAAFSPSSIGFTLTGLGSPQMIPGTSVTSDFFSVLGIQPVLGRAFLPEEGKPGVSLSVIVSHRFWEQFLHADPAAVGSSIKLDGKSYTVIGVLPLDFHFGSHNELWPILQLRPAKQRPPYWLLTMGRLKPGISETRAAADASLIARQVREQFPLSDDMSTIVVLTKDLIAGDASEALLILLGAVGFVLLIAVVNVANLQLSRSGSRMREFAIRSALGAGRRRLICQLLTESLILAALGGVLGLAIAYGSVRAILALSPDVLPRMEEITVDGRVLGLTALIAIMTGILFGFVPALRSTDSPVGQSLKEGSRAATSGRSARRLHGALVVAEFALALVVLTGAGLLIRTLSQLESVNPGFNSSHIMTALLSLPPERYAKAPQVISFYEMLFERVKNSPGVEAVSITMSLPPNLLELTNPFHIQGKLGAPGQPAPAVAEIPVGTDYFATLGIPLFRGRLFSDADRSPATHVLVINEDMARRYFPDHEPVGTRVQTGEYNPKGDWYTIVGVVGNVKYKGLGEKDQPTMYVPYFDSGWCPWFAREMYVVLRSASAPEKVVSILQSAAWSLDNQLPLGHVRTMDQLMYDSVAGSRFRAVLFCIFAALALVLAMIGIYGVMAYAVSQRTHEIGIRVALGAQRKNILRTILREGASLAVLGVAIGTASALVLSRTLAGLLFGVRGTDLGTFVTVAALLLGVALAACYIPARRAMRVDPMVALRYE
ncbi:MAG: ABC transporter permease [Acidobacteria bacterium]|nr:MAG: ABC transporter permease [Acidobacteriota bacterium]